MMIPRLITICGLAASFYAYEAAGQAVTAQPANNLVPLRFSAQARTLDTVRGRVIFTRITERDIIARALGITNSTGTNAISDYFLAYNPGVDRIQVAGVANGIPVADVLGFGGGAFVSGASISTRFAFVFMPGVTNPIGSVLISEYAQDTNGFFAAQTGFFRGQMQFALAGTNIFLGSPASGAGAGLTSQVPGSPGTSNEPTASGLVGTTSGLDTALGGDVAPALGPPATVNASAGGFAAPVVLTPGTSLVVTNPLELGSTNGLAPGASPTNSAVAPTEPVAGFVWNGTNGSPFLTTAGLGVTNNTPGIRVFTGYFEPAE